jgi:hypothetical protein
MYQFTTTNVINSQYAVDYDGNALLDSNGANVDKYVGSASQLFVAKVGTFKKANIVALHKRPYQAGVKEVAQITGVQVAAGLIYRLQIDLKLSQSTLSEYVNYSLDFKKPVTVEILATNNTNNDVASLVAALNTMKNRFGHTYVTASANGAVITLTAKDTTQRFASVVLSKEATSPNSIIQPEFTTVATGAVTTAGIIAFGDDAWMMRQVVLPTAENVRAFGVSKEERPVLGGNYTEYTLRYSIVKDGQDGTVSGATSITTHVFWVKATLVAGFETELDKLSLTIPYKLTAAVTTTATLSTGGDESDQMVVTGAIGAVTFVSDQPTRATVNATGMVTTLGVAGEGAVVVTVTDAVGNTAHVDYTITA